MTNSPKNICSQQIWACVAYHKQQNHLTVPSTWRGRWEKDVFFIKTKWFFVALVVLSAFSHNGKKQKLIFFSWGLARFENVLMSFKKGVRNLCRYKYVV